MEAERNPNENGPDPLRTLVERLMAPLETDGEPSSAPPRFYPGRLPDGLPNGLPLPDGATVVGGKTQNLGRGLRTTEIVLDVQATAEGFRESYRQRLFEAGWSEDEEWSHGRRGFTPRGLPGLFVRAARISPRLRRRLSGRVPGLPRPFPDVLYLGTDGPRLYVTAADRRNAPTDVRLRVLTGGRRHRHRIDPAWRAIPSLIPPSGARVRLDETNASILHPPVDARGLLGGGGRWEPDGVYSYATMETDIDLGDLASHYAAQLGGAGWNLADEGRSGPQAWSTWTFADAEGRPWDGTFSALRLFGASTRYLLQVYAGRASGSER